MKKYLIVLIMVMFHNFSYCQSSLSDSLKLFYPFNGNAIDESGYGHDGDVFNATLTTDRFDNDASAYEFDGYNDYILAHSTFDYINRSVSLWIKPYFIYGATPNNHVAITQDDFRLKHGLFRLDFDNGYINMWSGGAYNLYTSEGSIYVDKWSHIVLVRDSNYVYYYVAANLIHTSPANNYGSTYNADSNLVIGAGRSPNFQFFIGKIDDIRIYNRVLSQTEIEEIFYSDDPTTIEEVRVVNNPNSDKITIFNNFNGIYTVRVIDLSGRLILEENLSGNSYDITKNGLVTGMYLLQVINNQHYFTKKVIVN